MPRKDLLRVGLGSDGKGGNVEDIFLGTGPPSREGEGEGKTPSREEKWVPEKTEKQLGVVPNIPMVSSHEKIYWHRADVVLPLPAQHLHSTILWFKRVP